ncbi:MAG: peptide ABC transporter substrate-binding protein [Ardenticatenaceae bacterium]|nr:peptide ABC transporter substrate-binding protein [Ardenticatenaceae bacterium]
MNRNQWLLTIGILGTLCILAFACVAVAAGAIVMRNNAISLSGPQSPAPAAPGTSDERSGNQSRNTPAPEQTAPAVAGPTTKAGNTLSLPGDEPVTLDPHLTSDASSAEYIVEIFSGLVTLDRDLNLQPDIATEWKTDENGTLYTFTLRQDAKFANGKPITAKDFKYSFERACDAATESPVADTYLGDIVGCRDKLSGRANEVSGVRVVDDQTLDIQIDAPKVYFLMKLTYPTAFVVDQEAVEKGGRGWASKNPNGSGPFKLQEYTFGEKVVLVPNPNYYGDPKPSLDQITYTLSGGSAMTRYETDELDLTPVGLADIDRVLDKASPLNKELSIDDVLSISYIGLNAQQPPFDDVKVRQAFNLAIDKNALSTVVLRELAEPARGILPPEIPGSNPDVTGLGFDPERAKQLLQESKYAGNLPDVTLHVSGAGGAAPRTIEALAEMWRQNLGIEVAIEQTEFATFLSDLNSKPSPYQMYSIGWIADYPDPQDFLDILFHCDSLDNHSGYCNPDVDKLLEAARTETDEQKRMDLYHQAEEKILDDGAWVPLFYGKQYWLTKPYVQNMIFPAAIVPRMRYVSIRH